MGIPYFFKYLTKKFPQMIQRMGEQPPRPQALYLDSNSIIYDAVRTLSAEPARQPTSDDIIKQVIFKIGEYVALLRPSSLLFVAFDGVAPLAKMEQQRQRRLKATFQPFPAGPGPAPAPAWNTSQITPGTKFMGELSTAVADAFMGKERQYGVKQVIVSAANEPGEGEHKIFAHMRQARQPPEAAFVYGLDADLIMLSLLHNRLATAGPPLWVFREAPAFLDKAAAAAAPPEEELLFLNIDLLSAAIQVEMGGTGGQHIIQDYVFLCFFLGNDFLPHFPSLNIRTHGMPALIELYQGLGASFIAPGPTPGGKIQWSVVKAFLQTCAKCEHEWLMQEYSVRDRMAGSVARFVRADQPDDALSNVPLLFRAEEEFIAPGEGHWPQRYYQTLLEGARSAEVCRKYLEGLQWVWTYYTEGCTDWRWQYGHAYPPLWRDLAAHFRIPGPTSSTAGGPVHPQTQLAYVLPKSMQEELMGRDAARMLAGAKYEAYFVEPGGRFQWAFCRYFWEAHLRLPHIPKSVLDEWEAAAGGGGAAKN